MVYKYLQLKNLGQKTVNIDCALRHPRGANMHQPSGSGSGVDLMAIPRSKDIPTMRGTEHTVSSRATLGRQHSGNPLVAGRTCVGMQTTLTRPQQRHEQAAWWRQLQPLCDERRFCCFAHVCPFKIPSRTGRLVFPSMQCEPIGLHGGI